MVMLRLICILAIGTAMVFVSCTKEKSDAGKYRHGVETGEPGVVRFIKKQKLVDFQSDTIGDAFDSYRYLAKKEWKLESLKSGQLVVDFVGSFGSETLSDNDSRNGVARKALDAKFVVEPNGSFYLFMITITDMKADGAIYRSQIQDNAAVLNAIYANKKFPF